MPDFTKIPEAIDFVAGQSWLSPQEAGHAAVGPASPRPAAKSQRLSWQIALRNIAAILRRVG